jgi:hypothetical protein
MFRNVYAYTTFYLMLALGTGFLSAVADRFGFLGPGNSFGCVGEFSQLPALHSGLESLASSKLDSISRLGRHDLRGGLGIALILGLWAKLAAHASGVLTLFFGLAMIFALGVKAPLNYSIFAFSPSHFCWQVSVHIDGA